MAVYLFLVHGLSLISAGGPNSIPQVGPIHPTPDVLTAPLRLAGGFHQQMPALFAATGLLLLYACMAALFYLTRHLVKGPVWLGSLAGTVFMAHPVKTEILFTATGMVHLLSVLLALLTLLACLAAATHPGPRRYPLAWGLFALAVIPFTANALLILPLLLLHACHGAPLPRRWLRLLPFVLMTLIAHALQREFLYTAWPATANIVAPLLLLLYPIGLLPDTVTHLANHPLIAWGWGLFAIGILAWAAIRVKSAPFRIGIASIFLLRLLPGPETIDLATREGGAQLLLPLAMACLALAACSRWLMHYEPWARPTIALTTMLCAVLFVLQFQANRAWPPPALTPDIETQQVNEIIPHSPEFAGSTAP